MKTWVIVVLVGSSIVVVGSTVFLVTSGEPVQAARATHGEIHEFVDETGKTRLPEVHRITMPFPGRIEEITLLEGQTVKRGDIVAQIVRSDLEIAIQEARASVARYQAAIEENRDNSIEQRAREQATELVDSMIQTAKAAYARLTSSQKRLEYATKYRKDLEELFQENATSENEFQLAQVAEVDRQVEYAQDALIWQATESMRKAAELFPKIIDAYVERKEKTQLVLESQKAEAEARLEEMLTRQKRGTMTSPVDGVVLERLISNERFLPGGTELLTIGQMDQLEVETDVLSQDVGRIREGDRVEIYGPAVGAEAGHGPPGLVRRVYPAGFTKISSLGVEQQRVRVIVCFADDVLQSLVKEHNLGVDFRVRVRIFTAEKANALVIPRSSLFRGNDGRWNVFLVRWRRVWRQPVQIGLVNDEQVEIVDGLQDADQVVVAPENNLDDGVRVRATIVDQPERN